MAVASRLVPTWRSLDEAAEQSGVSRRTLNRWISDRKLRVYTRAGDRKRYVDLDEIRKLQQLQPVPTRDQVKADLGRLVSDMEAGRIADWSAAQAQAKEFIRLLRAPGIRPYDPGSASLIRRVQRIVRAHASGR